MGRMQGDKTDGQPRHAKPPFVGVGGRVEDRVDEAQDPWRIIEEEHEKLRKKEWAGFEYLWIALHEESFWRARLRAFGLNGQDALNPREIPGARQAQTTEERNEANQAHQQLLVWQTVAKAGAMILICEWIFDQVVEGFRRMPGAGTRPQPIADIGDWLPRPPGLSTKLFDVMRRMWVEAKAEVLGCIMEQYPKDTGGEQAAYLLAGLLRTRLKLGGNVGTRLRTGLSVLAGDASFTALKTQLLRELPATQRVAWEELGPSKGITGLRNLVSRLIARGAKDKTSDEHQFAEFVDREDMLKRGRDARLPPQEFELYKLLISNPSLKNKEYGAQLEISANHVGVLKSRIKKTLYA
jgi:hypothetical protein